MNYTIPPIGSGEYEEVELRRQTPMVLRCMIEGTLI